MKKLIAVFALIALVTGAAFADVSVAGAVETRLYIRGNSDDFENSTKIGGLIGTAWMQLSGSNDNGSMSGTFRLRGQDIAHIVPSYASSDPNVGQEVFKWHKAFVSWRPIEQLKLWLGQDADGLFEGAALAGWAYHQGSEEYLCVQHWDFWRLIYPGNWDGFGLAVSVYAVEDLDINLVIPTGKAHGWPRHQNSQLEEAPKFIDMFVSGLKLTANYKIFGVGTVMFSWRGPYNSADGYDLTNFNDRTSKTFNYKEFGLLGLSFLLDGPVEGLKAHLGASYYINANDGVDSPINLGLTAHYQNGDWGAKARIGSVIQLRDAGGMYMSFSLMPFYNISKVGNLFVDFGMSVNKPSSSEDAVVGWFLTPYFKKSIGNGYVQCGFGLFNKINHYGDSFVAPNDDFIKFHIPMLMGISL